MDDAWGDLFAKAEGSSITTTARRENDDDYHHQREDTDTARIHSSRMRKRRRRNNDKTGESSLKEKEEEEAFRSMLQLRIEVPHNNQDELSFLHQWPQWIHVGGSLVKLSSSSKVKSSSSPSSCSKFFAVPVDADSTNYDHHRQKKQLCQNCQQSALHHKISVITEEGTASNAPSGVVSFSTTSSWCHLHLFCHLRNIRCLAKAHIIVNNNSNNTHIIKSKHLLQSFKEEVDSFQKYLSFVCRNSSSSFLSPNEATILESKAQRLISTTTRSVQNSNNKKRKIRNQQQHHHQDSSTSSSDSSFDEMVRIILACDDVYYRLYYLQITHQIKVVIPTTTPSCSNKLQNDNKICYHLPHPQHYFGLPYLTADPTKETELCQDFVVSLMAATADHNKEHSAKTTTTTTCHDDGKKDAWIKRMKEENEDALQRVGILQEGKFAFFCNSDKNNNKNSHPLLELRRLRFLETAAIFHSSKWYQADTTQQEIRKALLLMSSVAKQNQEEEDEEETPAPALLMEWRDSCRDFLCHLYCYATLSRQSLEGISRFLSKNKLVEGGILEYGAGTGYLSKLLSDEPYNIPIRAMDICPTSSSSSSSSRGVYAASMNDFHGRTPSFLTVHQGSVDTIQRDLKQHSLASTKAAVAAEEVALLLCYTPPQSDMAYDILSTFVDKGGRAFIHVGEFKGLTGSSAFEKLLRKKFVCHERYPCLSWGTDASEVTLWMRRLPSIKSDKTKKKKKKEKEILLPCCFCGKVEAVRRCRLLRYLVYCSEDCFSKDKSSRDVHFKMNMIELGESFTLGFWNEKHFAKL